MKLSPFITLYRKALARLARLLTRVVPYNTHFRPHGVYMLHADAASPRAPEATLHPVYPRHETVLGIAEDLYQACSAYWKPSRRVVTDYLVAEVPNGRINTDNGSSVAVISRNNRLIDSVSLSLNGGKVTEARFNPVFEQRCFREPAVFSGTVFSMLTGGAGLNNISHWFLDVLPRLHLLQKSGLYGEVDWFLVPSLR